MLISFYSVQSGSRKHWKQGKGNGGWKWRISLCCWYLRCDWELPFLLRVRLLRSRVPRFWWVELLRWRAESNKQVAPLWHSHTIERKGRAIYLQPLFNRGLYQQKGNWSNGDMTDSYNLKDHICIELFSFMVMLSKKVNGKFKNAWFEFEFIPLTCLYRYYEAYFILYDIFLKDFLLDSFLLQI